MPTAVKRYNQCVFCRFYLNVHATCRVFGAKVRSFKCSRRSNDVRARLLLMLDYTLRITLVIVASKRSLQLLVAIGIEFVDCSFISDLITRPAILSIFRYASGGK